MTTPGRIIRATMGAVPAGRPRGIAITALGIIMISPDSLVIRIVDADVWTILALRAPATAAGLLGLLFVRYRVGILTMLRPLGGWGLAVAGLSAAGNIFFVFAITNTAVSNVLIILAGAPIFAGLLSWLTLDEKVGPRTWFAIALVVVGTTILIGPSDSGDLFGLVAAGAGMICMSATLTVTRHAKANDMTPALALAQVFVLLVALPLGGGDVSTLTRGDMMLLLATGLVMLPIASALFISGPRHMPAAEVGLLLPLETVLATALVWIVIGEQPSPAAAIGGTCILGALIWHSVDAMNSPVA